MKYFTVHSVCEDFFKMDLSDYILTFDDGLYSQFFYWNLIDQIKTEKILFITTGAILPSNKVREQYKDKFVNFKDCFESLLLWKNKNQRSNYMTLGELKYISSNYDVEIGAHSHNHYRLFQYGMTIVEKLLGMKKDVNTMFEWFETHLGIRPTSYCFPFNQYDSYLESILQTEGITQFFGSEREEIEDLCKSQ